jgi:hypothetical protein
LAVELLRLISGKSKFDEFGRHVTLHSAEILVSGPVVWVYTNLFPSCDRKLLTALRIAFMWLSRSHIYNSGYTADRKTGEIEQNKPDFSRPYSR